MQDFTAEGAIQELTATIIDADQKPYLRSTLSTALDRMGFEQVEIKQALDGFFQKQTVQ